MGNTTIRAVLPPDIASQFETCLTRTSNIKIYSFLLGFAGWIMSIFSTASVQWRVWHVENITTGHSDTIWIGIWKVCFVHDSLLVEDHDPMHCHIFLENDTFIPVEIFLAQDLMTLAIIVEAMAIIVLCLGFWNIYEDKGYKKLIDHLFFLGSVLNSVSGILILMPISWNMISVLAKTQIPFPTELHVPGTPKKQAIGVALYVGLMSAAFQLLSGSFILIEKCFSADGQIHPEENQGITCPHCNSSLEIHIRNKFISDSSSPSRGSPTDSADQFTVPAGSVRSRTISSTDFHQMLVNSHNP